MEKIFAPHRNNAVRDSKIFVLGFLVSATIIKIAEAVYKKIHYVREPISSVKYTHFFQDAISIDSTTYMFILYFLLTLFRHFGAVYSSSGLFDEDRTHAGKSRFGILILFDYIATFLLFFAHYVISYSVFFSIDDAQRGVDFWRTELSIFMALALFLDIIICGSSIFYVFLTDFKRSGKEKLLSYNFIWVFSSSIEFYAFVMITLDIDASRDIRSFLFVALGSCVVDIILTRGYWIRVIEGSYGSDMRVNIENGAHAVNS